MKIAFILDPLPSLKIYKDSSIAMMREAAQRGHQLYVLETQDMSVRQGKVQFLARQFQFSDGDSWYVLSESEVMLPNQFDAVIMRKDPPFDSEYLYSTHVLELAVQQGAHVLNRPDAIRGWNEKLSVARFPQFAPDFIVTKKMEEIRQFQQEFQDIVVKPLDGMGGSSIFRVRRDDPNTTVILETMTQFETRTIMVQRYLPAIQAGDKRILIINGTPQPYCLARIPMAGETRGNLAAGGRGVAQALSETDRCIAETIAPVLKAQGLFLVGLDVIGEHLTEINVTSPTCMVEIAAQTDSNPAREFIIALEQQCGV